MSFEMDQVRATQEHIRLVGGYLQKCILQLVNRSRFHDASKFDDSEWPYFVAHTAKLSELTYGSPEYKDALDAMRPAIEQHYSKNRHHPEHFVKWSCNGCFTEYHGEMPNRCTLCGYSQMQKEPDLSQMSLVKLLEMLCDWIAATARHNDGDILKSLEVNQERFRYSDEMKKIFTNTVEALTQSARK